MANKENLPPRIATPPVSKISPSNKPALGRQRDHSACRAAETPLKVKKTRENLKQASAYADVPPPCLHVPHAHRFCTAPEDAPQAGHAQQRLTDLAQASAVVHPHALPEQRQPQPQPQPSHSSLNVQHNSDDKLPRQKSVSRRVLSRVKQGIAASSSSKSNKSSSQSIRPTGSETSLARRLSGRSRKRSVDVSGSRSLSFELSRDSIESSGLDEDVGGECGSGFAVQRSFTGSTVSTEGVLGELAAGTVPGFARVGFGDAPEETILEGTPFPSSSLPPPAPSSPSPQPTPRPLRKSGLPVVDGGDIAVVFAVPCVEMRVTIDTASVDVSCKRDVWIAVDAFVRLNTTKIASQATSGAIDIDAWKGDASLTSHGREHSGEQHCRSIMNLRLCYKPADGCRIRNIVGQKSYRDLTPGQQCTLFLKVGIPRIHTPTGPQNEPNQASLFTELESIIGTLETDILHVEARYRHSLLPTDNVVALKHTCKILRPKTESRWSGIGFYEKARQEEEEDAASAVHTRSARYLADHYAADEALELLHRYFDYDARSRPGMAEVCSMLQERVQVLRSGFDELQPEVVVTDIDLAPDVAGEKFDTAPSTPLELAFSAGTERNRDVRVASLTAGTPSSKATTSLLSAPPRTTSLTRTATLTSNSKKDQQHALDSSHPDSARALWRHIRRTSLSARQLEDLSSPERLSQMEAGDEGLRALRQRALANKRSVGVETLRGWRWEGVGEAPWM